MIALMRAFFGCAIAAALVASTAAAQDQQDPLAAQALFDEAKKLMQEGRYDEACPKLVQSQRYDPGGGTLLALGLCHEAQGKTASAWTDFNLALSEARKNRRTDREATAAGHLRTLEARLARARVVVATPSIDGLEVRRDGVVVGAALFGTPVPIDPGEHVFEARATGKRVWRKAITVHDSEVLQIDVPALEDAPAPPPPPPAIPTTLPPASTAPPPPPPPVVHPRDSAAGSGSSLRAWGFVVGGVGIASAAVGTGLALSASSIWNDVNKACPNNKCADPVNITRGGNAGTAADVSTVFFVVGGVGVASAVTILILASSSGAPNPPATGVRIYPMLGQTNGIALGGRL